MSVDQLDIPEQYPVTLPEAGAGGLRFSPLAGVELTIKGMSFGDIDESSALVSRWRPHLYMDEMGAWYEYNAQIPFGSEPVIKRRLDFAYNHCLLSTECILKKGFPVKEIAIDNLVLTGRWTKLLVISYDPVTLVHTVDHHDLASVEAGTTLYQGNRPFLGCVAENADGERFEVGIGNDLWRWNLGSDSGDLEAQFSITHQEGSIEISRRPLVYSEECEINRNWRFKWYFAWAGKELAAKQPDEPEGCLGPDAGKGHYSGSYFRLASNWPEEASVIQNGHIHDCPCFKSAYTGRLLKAFVRNQLNQSENKALSIQGCFPHLCDNAAHLERPKKKVLLHYDLVDVLDLHFWANRQLCRVGSSLSFFSEDSALAELLPSIQGLALDAAK